MAFHFKDVPERDNIEFRTLVERPRRVSKFPDTYKNSQTTPSPASSSLRPVDPLQEASNQRRAPYISFGEQGTTATAGAYGSLLRTCRPISKLKGSNGFPNSGIIGLEFASTEPWYVSGRANLILENAHDASCGFGLLVQNDLSSDRPTVEFVDGRWPVIKYSTKEGFAVTVRLWCQHDTVVQHMHVMNPKLVTGEKPELRINLDPNFSMQDLDYLREKKNESTRYEKGVNDHGIIVMQVPGLRDKNDDDNEKLCDARELVSVLIGLFKDGAAQELQLNYTEDERETKSRVQPIPITHPLGRDESVEFTTAFKTHTTTLEAHWRRFMIPSEEVIFDPHLSSLVNSTMMKLKDMSWYLYRNLEHIMSVCSIPIDLDSLDETGSISSDRLKNYGPTIALTSPGGERDILSRTEPTVRSIRPIALTCGDFGDHRVSMLGS
ncbi:hypothetical protein N7478_001845 [Penicillium angulare]|uniref:uncharacterized protein n=1 Tax=Penicillium angulare TaxID=116970 RepID=UPI002541771C|nr:uncharacterized protein N7478_001845 [Penicillium angulare]KAJ5288815.1 hypothetical protein N7478_001845 [Penicillium angulare]